MTDRTATERDVRVERSHAYIAGGALACAYMFDALASGLSLAQAKSYACDMVENDAKAVAGTFGRVERDAARDVIRAKHGVGATVAAAAGHKHLA